jgi:riboflavin biosynthesis pyrimidine reductase
VAELEWARDRVARALAAGPRQRLILVAVASLDFAAAVAGRSKQLSSPADKALMFAWREAADVLLVGPRTLEAERYGSLLPPDSPRPWPPVATVSRSGVLDFERILRAKRPPELTVYGPVDPRGPVPWRPADDLAAAVRDLRTRGAQTIVCEGGPTIYAQLVAANLATDLSLTLAPALVGAGPSLFDPVLRAPARPVRTVDVAAVGDHVFLHYDLSSQASTSTIR